MNNKKPAPKTPRTCAATSERPPFFRRVDIWIIAILALVGVVWLALTLATSEGTVAIVTVTQGTSQHVQIIPLSTDNTIHVDANLPTTLHVEDGTIRFINSQCPDHTCESFGQISREGEWALCAPAGVLVSIQEDS